jgi:hypothetical protein
MNLHHSMCRVYSRATKRGDIKRGKQIKRVESILKPCKELEFLVRSIFPPSCVPSILKICVEYQTH